MPEIEKDLEEAKAAIDRLEDTQYSQQESLEALEEIESYVSTKIDALKESM